MLEVKNVKIKYYDDEVMLNFSFDKGVTLILGEVGSFKTSLFFVIGGLKEIEDGEIILDGVNIEEVLPKNRNMTYVGLNSTPTGGNVLKALAQPLILRKVDKKQAKIMATNAALGVGLNANLKIKELSKIQLVAFFKARLSLRETQVSMFDEPYHYFGEENCDTISEMIRSRKGYVLVSSCASSDIKRINPDCLVVVRRDKVLQCGKTQDVLNSPINEYVKKLLSLL